MSAFKERAFLVCRDAGGNLSHGPVVEGKGGSVKMPTHCPAGTKPVAVVHTHPPDDYLTLSGTRLRGMLSQGVAPPPEFSRPEVARILMEHYRL